MAISPGAPQEPLPIASNEYDPENETMTRRSIEFGLEELGNEVFIAKTQGDKDGSGALEFEEFHAVAEKFPNITLNSADILEEIIFAIFGPNL